MTLLIALTVSVGANTNQEPDLLTDTTVEWLPIGSNQNPYNIPIAGLSHEDALKVGMIIAGYQYLLGEVSRLNAENKIAKWESDFYKGLYSTEKKKGAAKDIFVGLSIAKDAAILIALLSGK